MSMIENIVAKMARIPPKSVSASDTDALRKLERDLKLVIFGQDKAIEALAASIKMARSGSTGERNRLVRSCLPGPTGVGKTEVTRQLAMTWVSNCALRYVRIHGAPHGSRLIGAPPGYVGSIKAGS